MNYAIVRASVQVFESASVLEYFRASMLSRDPLVQRALKRACN
jgi:hypothetical protein